MSRLILEQNNAYWSYSKGPPRIIEHSALRVEWLSYLTKRRAFSMWYINPNLRSGEDSLSCPWNQDAIPATTRLSFGEKKIFAERQFFLEFIKGADPYSFTMAPVCTYWLSLDHDSLRVAVILKNGLSCVVFLHSCFIARKRNTRAQKKQCEYFCRRYRDW